ncbi:efflux RND transporter periplasmic adaptor subunit [Candidatus Methylopumilus planktonicus]|uniref:efflux RND transporter periplasmic adaptor subunit n=1 Tax=Candidatus Methylopumilus planktonicus TaxID=1581557 RepID=UPI001CB97318|nr:efflux RND transporter periplasmic adaptor subunit [Candidatus Methylopumilus planktonicus]
MQQLFLSSRSVLLIGFLLFSLVGCQKPPEQSGMPPNFVLPVTMLESIPVSMPITAEAVGQTEGAKEVEIRPRVGGILLKRKYNEGSPVKAGQILFNIDPEPYKIALNQARAQYNQSLARAEQAKREKKRLEGLIESQSISQREFDNASSDESISVAALAQSRANLKQAELNLSYTNVTAPVDGISGRFQFSEGALISANTSLLTTLAQVNPIWVRFSFSDNELKQLGGALNEKNIQEVSITLSDGNEYPKKGKINFAASEINPSLGTQELRATFENNERQILPGQFVRVRVTTGKKDGVFLLPQLAVLNSDQGKFVFVVNEKNQATPRPVITGEWKGKDWVILGGLQAGDKIIIDNLIKVRPGMPVTNMPNFKK